VAYAGGLEGGGRRVGEGGGVQTKLHCGYFFRTKIIAQYYTITDVNLCLSFCFTNSPQFVCTRDGHGSGRPAGRVGSGRVGSRVRVKAELAGRVGSGQNFLNALFFLFVSRLK